MRLGFPQDRTDEIIIPPPVAAEIAACAMAIAPLMEADAHDLIQSFERIVREYYDGENASSIRWSLRSPWGPTGQSRKAGES